jgi:hypothetical protein
MVKSLKQRDEGGEQPDDERKGEYGEEEPAHVLERVCAPVSDIDAAADIA